MGAELSGLDPPCGIGIGLKVSIYGKNTHASLMLFEVVRDHESNSMQRNQEAWTGVILHGIELQEG